MEATTRNTYHVQESHALDAELQQRLVNLGRADNQCALCHEVGTERIPARGHRSEFVDSVDDKGKPVRIRKEIRLEVCQNVTECHERLEQTLRQDDKLAKMLDGGHVPFRLIDPKYRPLNKKDATMTKAPKSRAQSRATKREATSAEPGICEFSGEPTGPGKKFRPGYDAKLKSALGKAAAGGDVDAQVEIDIRQWPTKKGTPDEVINAAADKRAEIGDAEAQQAWLDKRVKARLTAVSKGVDPVEAVQGKRTPSKGRSKSKAA